MEHQPTQNSNLGKVEIAPEVLQVISGLAATQVKGVIGLSGSVVENFNQLIGRKNLRQGITVNLDESTTIEASLVVEYGVSIPEVGKQVQESIKSAVETMTGIEVDQIVVRVEGIKFPQPEKTKDGESNSKVR
ncbi:Asp23/Gls24 family envelope stress response protein [Thermoactinomyces sp. DSM 45892]|uniref:Asp23/Gls24 family envelope stress response protein n=1 Tax=Thermoactinomyces sp. DSM 45892 TaxID=1882753 RepID=UPI000898FC41|nr:Asp23/Gls24 family envelope stress response protein [Thermoactinomyces sp. DSM 45892]SDZ03337.1 Uncharacterized conserved protein YloU, alkaline shock protein (Asp23) family [Thermoactinomyces sp. DSM 45892]